MALVASGALAVGAERASVPFAQAGPPFYGGPIVPIFPEDPSGGPGPKAAIGPPGGGGISWQPPATITSSYPDLDVIAGTVLDRTALSFHDSDTGPLGLQIPNDVYWDRTITTSGGTTLETHYDPNGSTPTSSVTGIVWEAPLTECDVTVTRTATDYVRATAEYEGTSDPVTLVDYQTIHVHQLEVLALWGGEEMFWEINETDDTWHRLDTEPGLVACQGWGNSTEAVPYLKYQKDVDLNGVDADGEPRPGLTNPMLFCGQRLGYERVALGCVEGHTVDVVDVPIRLHAEWPREGVEFSGTGTVASLAAQAFELETDEPLDPEVNWYEDETWDWKYDANWGEIHIVADVDVTGDPTIPGVGTSHAAILLGDAEITPKRVEGAYTGLSGQSTDEGIAGAAATWAHGIGESPMSWCADPDDDYGPNRSANDVWCVRCYGGGGDCTTMAMLAARACQLAGVDATDGIAYPQESWGNDWRFQDKCFASVRDAYFHTHDAFPLAYWALGAMQSFEGFFEVGGTYWTCFPVGQWPDLPTMVTSLASHWVCVEQPSPGFWLWHHDGEQYNAGANIHEIPEPTP